MKNIIVRPIEHDDLPEMWAVAFGPSADLKWMELNGPYLMIQFGRGPNSNNVLVKICWGAHGGCRLFR
ncbi:Uncharacterised protein [Weissella viridescens]|uniref:Uncharacterized protein n=1 Tax=Weissella viridescens TaxID=1629 RepID=A0A380NYE8_WEIVI|nr:Uncharacterised protein [Weissella viridescens]